MIFTNYKMLGDGYGIVTVEGENWYGKKYTKQFKVVKDGYNWFVLKKGRNLGTTISQLEFIEKQTQMEKEMQWNG